MWPLIPSRLSRKARYVRPSPTLFFCLVGAFLLTVVPHVPQLPLWVSGCVVAAMIIRSLLEIFHWRLPSAAFCGVVALCLLAAIYLQFDTIFGREAGTAFMAALLAIKFFEMRGPRDVALIIFCSFFLVMSSLLYSQAVELFVYCLIMMWVLTALLLRTSMGDLPENRLLLMLKTAGMIFLQAFPLALFLFFFFPRYHGVLQLGVGDTSIGLTDKVEPGSIARLAADDSIAMSVKFSGRVIPSADTLYWRAIVLWNYENGAWVGDNAGETAPKNRQNALPQPARDSSDITQEITIWPHFHRWLFALDYPVSLAEPINGAENWSEGLTGGALRLLDPTGVVRKQRYTVTSASQIRPQELEPGLRDVATTLPDDPNDHIDPRVQALARQLHLGCVTEDDYIRAVLHYFRHGGFHYTDSPGPQGKDPLANFLLRSKSGFCEHYASAFAVLMRLQGIPARMVIGYQGAQYNPYKDIYIVKQSNAHAWDEVWMEKEKEWRREDPTAILPSSQTGNGLSSSAAQGSEDESLSIELADHRLTFASAHQLPSWLRQGLLEIQLRREEVEADWDDWVFSYDPEAQNRLAQALGFGVQKELLLGLTSLGAALIFGLVFGLTLSRRPVISPVEKFYARFCRKMAQRGVPRAAWEGPLAYTNRLALTFPEKSDALVEAGRLVAQTRYGSAPPPATRADLKSLLLLITASDAASSSRERR